MASRNKRVSPRPIFVTHFAGGEVTRLSHGMLVGESLPFEAAKRGACQIIGNERARTEHPACDRLAYFPPATDVVDSYFEWDGKVYREGDYTPFKQKADPVAKLIAAIAKLPLDRLPELQRAIEARLPKPVVVISPRPRTPQKKRRKVVTRRAQKRRPGRRVGRR